MKTNKEKITVQVSVNVNIESVWEKWTNPIHVITWNTASDDWHTTKAENDLRIDGKFNYRMEAKDGSFRFDFWGIYKKIQTNELLGIVLGDEREMSVKFIPKDGRTEIIETFEAEETNSIELQKNGWQAILNNFKKYVESY